MTLNKEVDVERGNLESQENSPPKNSPSENLASEDSEESGVDTRPIVQTSQSIGAIGRRLTMNGLSMMGGPRGPPKAEEEEAKGKIPGGTTENVSKDGSNSLQNTIASGHISS